MEGEGGKVSGRERDGRRKERRKERRKKGRETFVFIIFPIIFTSWK